MPLPSASVPSATASLEQTWEIGDASGPHVRLSEVLAGLSYALDLTEGQRPGHSVRSCLIGMRLAAVAGLPQAARSSLFYALLMKDLGCSSNAARFAALFGSSDHDLKTDLKHIDWAHALQSFRFVIRNTAPDRPVLQRVWRVLAVMARGPEGARAVVRTRCERGAEIARLLGLPDDTAQAIRGLDEHWDGRGQPYGTKGEDIPWLARVLGLSQTVEVFYSAYGLDAAYDMAIARRGRWFDPDLVDALRSMRGDAAFWQGLGAASGPDVLSGLEPPDRVQMADESTLDRVARAFAGVIDAKSPWTFRHSEGVADVAVTMGHHLGLDAQALRQLRRAALLHDLGKLGVSNLILDKPGKLTDEEFAVMRRHPLHTAQILERVSCFGDLVEPAASHHERLDGRGYHRGQAAEQIALTTRILAVADVCDALRASRPYRAGLPVEQVLGIIGRESGKGLDAACVEALRTALLDHAPDATPDVPAVRKVAALAEDYQQAA